MDLQPLDCCSQRRQEALRVTGVTSDGIELKNVPNAAGDLPPPWHATGHQNKSKLSQPAGSSLLVFYDLANEGSMLEKKSRLLRSLGLLPNVTGIMCQC